MQIIRAYDKNALISPKLPNAGNSLFDAAAFEP
jgi:hypothetical protein